jgi:hypothetical protein
MFWRDSRGECGKEEEEEEDEGLYTPCLVPHYACMEESGADEHTMLP